MKKFICLLLAAFTLASVSSVNAAGFSKHHHGARHAAASITKKVITPSRITTSALEYARRPDGFSAESFSQMPKLFVQRHRQARAELGVVGEGVFGFISPTRTVHREQLRQISGGQIQAG